jgi:solute carrier family 25 protein 39/40
VTPFDLIKTRLQTQPTSTPTIPTLFPRPPLQAKAGASSGLTSACCRPSPLPCVRNISSLAVAYPSHVSFAGQSGSVVCLWDGTWRSERVKGFWDAVVKVSKAEGVSGLWKGVGTSLSVDTCLIIDGRINNAKTEPSQFLPRRPTCSHTII